MKAQYAAKHVENGETDPNIKFIEECAKENTFAIPILRKIQNNSLILKDIKLNTGQARGLLGNFMMTKGMVQRLYLNNNGLSD